MITDPEKEEDLLTVDVPDDRFYLALIDLSLLREHWCFDSAIPLIPAPVFITALGG